MNKLKIFILTLLICLFTFTSAYSANRVLLGPEYFPQDAAGRALAFADIYVGEPDTDPEVVGNQKQLYVLEEDGTLTSVTQPITTSAGGVPLYNGDPVTLFVYGAYSLKVLNSSGSQVYYVPSSSTADIDGTLVLLSDYDDLADAVSSIGSDPTELWIDVDDTMDENITSIPTTLKFKFIEGNTITTNGYTLDFAGGPQDHIIAIPGQQCFDGTVSFTEPGVLYPAWAGAVADGSTSDQAAIENIVSSATAGSELHFPGTSNYYRLTDEVVINKALNISGIGEESHIKQETDGKYIFKVTASDVKIHGIKLEGTGSSAISSGSTAIYIEGTNGTPLTGVKVYNNYITTWKDVGIYAKYSRKMDIHHNTLIDIAAHAMQMYSLQHSKIHDNHIEDLQGHGGSGNDSYGMYIGRLTNGDAKNISLTIHNNTFNDIDGSDHAAAIQVLDCNSVSIVGNTGWDIRAGVFIVHSLLTDGDQICNDVTITGNSFDSAVTNGTAEEGIHVNAGNGAQMVTITGNTVKGFGEHDSLISGGILVQSVQGAVVNGNTILEPSPSGIYIGAATDGASIIGNVVIDPWSNAVGVAACYGILTASGIGMQGAISVNTILDASKSATYTLASASSRSIKVSADSEDIVLGVNFTPDASIGYANGVTGLHIDEYHNFQAHMEGENLADEGSVDLPAPGLGGFGFAQIGEGEEYALFSFTRTAVVTLISNSANVVNTDTDTNFCIFDNGTYVTFKNRLGSAKRLLYQVWYR